MSEILFQYERVPPATWVYLSSLLAIGLFFKFNRFWSVRNLDLLLLILLAPGLLLVHFGSAAREAATETMQQAGWQVPQPATVSDEIRSALTAESSETSAENAVSAAGNVGVPPGDPEILAAAGETAAAPAGSLTAVEAVPITESSTREAYARAVRKERRGYVWLFSVGALLLVRLLLDPTMVRRPLLEPNLSTGGLAFIGVSLFVFIMANVITSTPTDQDLEGPRDAAALMRGQDTEEAEENLRRHGPGYALLNVFPSIPTIALRSNPPTTASPFVAAAKGMAILLHLAIVIGLVAIGYRHFNNIQTGIGVATLYLMLPYTAVMTGRIEHVMPATLLVWAVACYRQPLLAGMFIGLSAGVVYYPMFLLPLWLSFYWRRGLTRFLIGLLSMLALMVVSLIFISADWASFMQKVGQMFGIWVPRMTGLEGIWGLGWDSSYRMPVLALFAALSLTMAIWPAQKNLGTLLSCSAALMVATQFWHGYGGGLFMAWYLPLALLTIFRPNLEDRVALTVLVEPRFFFRRSLGSVDRAA